jgi:predicted RNA binding protein YcfA (HicA-like mRNA interferase family)
MPSFGPTTRAELIRCLRQMGFQDPFSGAKHQFMMKGQLRLRIPNPHRTDIGRNLLRLILKQANVTIAEWEQL